VVLGVGLAGVVGWGLYRRVGSIAASRSSGPAAGPAADPGSGTGGASWKISLGTNKPLRWVTNSIEFVRVSRGELPDVAGQGYWQSSAELAVLNGATGKVLWHHPGDANGRVFADGQDAILLATGSNALIRYGAATGDQRWKIQVAAYISDVTFASDCAKLLLSGVEEPVGISLATGAVQACSAGPPEQSQRFRYKPKDAHFNHGEWTIESSIQRDPKPINPDPPRLVVRATQSGRELFRQASLPIAPMPSTYGEQSLVVDSDAGVFVFGCNAVGKTAWGLIELPSGRIAYSQIGAAGVCKEDWIPAIAGARSLVFVHHNWTLEAYHAQSGRLVWTASEE